MHSSLRHHLLQTSHSPHWLLLDIALWVQITLCVAFVDRLLKLHKIMCARMQPVLGHSHKQEEAVLSSVLTPQILRV